MARENRSKSFRTGRCRTGRKRATGRLAVLRAGDFRLFYAGYVMSLGGTAMSSVAIAFAFLGTGGTATGLGIVFTANIVPTIVFLLFGGAFGATVEQRLIAPAALSRVGAINMLGAFAFGPLAFIAAGPAAGIFGARTVLGFGAASSAAMTLAVLTSPAIRRQPWPSPPSSAE
jgi:hypothetical protein